MVARTASPGADGDIEVGYCDIYAVQMSTNDTTTLSDFSASQNITKVVAIKKSDRTDVTTSTSNNVITLTQAGLTNVDLLIFAAGVKAA